jgi:hypothetical protein
MGVIGIMPETGTVSGLRTLSLDPPKGGAFRRSSVAGLTAVAFAATTGKADLRRSGAPPQGALSPNPPARAVVVRETAATGWGDGRFGYSVGASPTGTT